MVEIESRSPISPSVENSFRKEQWTSCKTDYGMNGLLTLLWE